MADSYDCWLACAVNTAEHIEKLLSHFQTAKEVFEADEKEIRAQSFLGEAEIAYLTDPRKESNMEMQSRFVGQNGIRAVRFDEEGYPERFLSLADRPYCIFYQGELPDKELPALAVVGSRRPSIYGEEMTEDFAGALAGAGVVIISGVAMGIDGISHKAALQAGGMTVGILGSGIGVPYPKENWTLYREMCEKGCVISQDPKSETEVAPGTTVNAVVSLGPKPVEQVAVPNVDGDSWSEAKSEIQNAGLEAAKSGDEDGKVTSQDPAAGEKVDKGTTVTVTLTADKPQAEVPKVVGMKWADAKKALEKTSFKVNKTGDDDGIVTKQDPKAGETVDEDATITVTVDGKAKVKVPNVVGQSVESARQALTDAGLTPDPSIPNHGIISAQDPDKGEAKFGTVVKLTVDSSDFE